MLRKSRNQNCIFSDFVFWENQTLRMNSEKVPFQTEQVDDLASDYDDDDHFNHGC